jgi:hypothetical protein
MGFRQYWRMNMRTIVIAIFFVALLGAALVAADYAQTTVWFTVATSVSFTVTIPGAGATSSTAAAPGTATGDVYVNATTVPVVALQPCANPDFSTNCQVTTVGSARPIFNYSNTGNVALNMTIRFNSTLPSYVAVWGNSTCSAGTCSAAKRPVNESGVSNEKHYVVQGLPTTAGNWAAEWLYVNFSSGATGGAVNRVMLHNSTSDI